MTAAERLGALMFRAMDKMRDRAVFDIGDPTGADFTGFDAVRQIVLVTFKRSREAMPSPINHGVADGRIYVRTDPSTGKVKRIRNNPNVVVVPCGLRGKPKGQPVAGVARILPESEHAHAEQVIAANWSWAMKIFERGLDRGSAAVGIAIAYIEITPAGG
ncbi:PPOX class F420-dependent oxidoreductase [[Mycobacterium] vasticus]|uniref:PPOX class F420-dependent oxidoreductase n=1 Tax=[Mycobacterium] vasticus TaxID=2875777 RepID=A0ABU5YXV8_9MYCO|nr:PPOX class F420-dependent oxidoreductase [Mycolicibacter sp. MYC017]MEB3069933.1 PPOX class F420-dependent oxidoreductase [Mycolicibacter sp. MYC017]